MNDFDKKLDFDSDTFENMKHDMNFVLQRLLGNMIEKQSNEGSMTIKIDVTMVKEFIPNYDPNIKGESREISKPQFKHKVTSAVKITDEKGGNLNNEMEMVMDEETGCYVLQPIANTQQRTIFDSYFMQGQKQEGEGNEDIIDGTYIDADVRPALPGPADEEKPAEEEETDTQPAEEETQSDGNTALEYRGGNKRFEASVTHHMGIKREDSDVSVQVITKTRNYWFFDGGNMLNGKKNLNSIYRKEYIQ